MIRRASPLIVLVLLAGCASTPSGPGVLVLPGTGRSFDQFRADEADCRQYASAQLGGQTPNQAGADSGIASAAVGAAVGTLAGAALGGNSAGAAAGAGAGLAVGALAGTTTAQGSARTLQQRYDFSYTQCMYAKGHKAPVLERADRYDSARHLHAPPPRYAAPPPPSSDIPTPPPPSSAIPPPPPPPAAR
jgi:hypothetical protein